MRPNHFPQLSRPRETQAMMQLPSPNTGDGPVKSRVYTFQCGVAETKTKVFLDMKVKVTWDKCVWDLGGDLVMPRFSCHQVSAKKRTSHGATPNTGYGPVESKV